MLSEIQKEEEVYRNQGDLHVLAVNPTKKEEPSHVPSKLSVRVFDSDPKHIYCRNCTFYVASSDYNLNLPDNYTFPNRKFLAGIYADFRKAEIKTP